MQIEHLYISPGHNFVGHHGKPPGEHPVTECDSVECVAGRGLRGDRYFDHKEDYKGQITFFDADVLRRICIELGIEGTAAATRRNVIARGADLNALIDRPFEVQGIRFFGVEECRPCYWMNHAFRDERVEGMLKGHGGLRARILSDGILRRSR